MFGDGCLYTVFLHAPHELQQDETRCGQAWANHGIHYDVGFEVEGWVEPLEEHVHIWLLASKAQNSVDATYCEQYEV